MNFDLKRKKTGVVATAVVATLLAGGCGSGGEEAQREEEAAAAQESGEASGGGPSSANWPVDEIAAEIEPYVVQVNVRAIQETPQSPQEGEGPGNDVIYR